jgi:glycosyltransferase involved in cell wall biosynthesis
MRAPTISAAIRAYNAEEHIAETLTAVLSQTRPPDEVVVVDDGSTDGTPAELERFRGDVRIVRQANGGYASAFNRSFEEAHGDFVANCDADDIWESRKLERQWEALRAHPEIDIAFGAARFFGLRDAPFNDFSAPWGVLDCRAFSRRLYRGNPLCTSSTLVRRRLFLKVGLFRDSAAPSEDYDYWLRAVRAGAVFFYDPDTLVRYRLHSNQVSGDQLRMHRAELRAHTSHSALAEDSRLVRRVLARDLSNIARVLSDQDRSREARATFADSLRHWPTLRVIAWMLVLSAPSRYRRSLADHLVSTKRTLISRLRRSTSTRLST